MMINLGGKRATIYTQELILKLQDVFSCQVPSRCFRLKWDQSPESARRPRGPKAKSLRQTIKEIFLVRRPGHLGVGRDAGSSPG